MLECGMARTGNLYFTASPQFRLHDIRDSMDLADICIQTWIQFFRSAGFIRKLFIRTHQIFLVFLWLHPPGFLLNMWSLDHTSCYPGGGSSVLIRNIPHDSTRHHRCGSCSYNTCRRTCYTTRSHHSRWVRNCREVFCRSGKCEVNFLLGRASVQVFPSRVGVFETGA